MLACFVSAVGGLQAAKAAHPIDTAVKQCILARSSVDGAYVCSHAGAEEWEDEVERVFEFLKERYEDQGRNKELSWLATSQAQWESYRKLYFAKLDESCRGDAGCIAQTSAERMRFWRARYRELENKIDCQGCFAPYDGQKPEPEKEPDVVIQPIQETP